MKTAMMALLFVASLAQAHVPSLESFNTKPILADLKDLRALNIPVMAKDEFAEVGYAVVTPKMQQRIQEYAHANGKCGGFEDLSQEAQNLTGGFDALLGNLASLKQKNELYDRAPFRALATQKNEALASAITEINVDNMKATVQWLSSYPDRNNRSAQPNVHVEDMKKKLEAMLASSTLPYEVSLVSHTSTKQKSVRVRLTGSEKPNEIVVLGGHLDSINMGWGSGNKAPGADDNASGSANLLEALRIVSQKVQPKRTVDFFWYAGEESGLLGSAEIAKQYKAQNADVVAVLQLDMTLFPGSGELVIGSMTDFTSAWLRDYLKAANETYIGARIVEDKCGYGCSDHASWHRQGYPAIMPFEARMNDSNPNIHSARDLVSKDSNFNHSVAYTKIALVFAMDLANSTARQPY
ncbi:M20/M25/M40 family metallo-hydrolase [Bdellovibrio svalbardensis]|uniref:M20/M25/M40 family metallo-hydrolase n=1 Tax=Bdellovibrio svalbardensis TaxID=2972972 RepID=A0ABT6DEH2_9BACT|nr:M20/M25/M40 family metallo-hydrolase [Bdellovibrio svalbardensis]MDG0815188.1 M20/M25/M40 family metallo-hydrolase [Bdellovibrio svalbardensis]